VSQGEILKMRIQKK